MFRTMGIKKNIENIFSLSQPYAENGDVSFLGLKRAYKKFLTHIQPSVPTSSLNSVEFIKDPSRSKQLVALFAEKSRLDDFDRIFSDRPQIQNGLQNVESFFYKLREVDASLFSLFSLAINIIFSGPSELASGGSSSVAIGCIWINPRENWSQQDCMEFFIHEMTHNLVFLDEYCHHHYESYSKMFLESNYAPSAILSKRRPLDKVFHSILVSTEVLLARKAVLGHPKAPKLHPPTPIMLDQTFKSIGFLEETEHVYSLLNTRGKELISICKAHLQDVKADLVLLPPVQELVAVPNLNNTAISRNRIY
jgi:hypothetical protein